MTCLRSAGSAFKCRLIAHLAGLNGFAKLLLNGGQSAAGCGRRPLMECWAEAEEEEEVEADKVSIGGALTCSSAAI